MKKYYLITAILLAFIIPNPSDAVTFGSYNTETEYGLFDGFKFNFSRKDKSQKFIELREPDTKDENLKNKDSKYIDEDIRIRNMMENRSII